MKILLSAEQIRVRVSELAAQIERDYAGQELTLVGVLKGSFIFMADLMRALSLPLRCDFLRISSYDGKGKRGSIRLDFDLIQPIEGAHVLLIEDILDTGQTLRFLLSHLATKKPKSLEICSLLDKNLDMGLSEKVRYVGFQVPKEYLIGYGLDLDGRFRELPYVAQLQVE